MKVSSSLGRRVSQGPSPDQKLSKRPRSALRLRASMRLNSCILTLAACPAPGQNREVLPLVGDVPGKSSTAEHVPFAAGPAPRVESPGAVDVQDYGSRAKIVNNWSAVYQEGMTVFYERFYGDPTVVPPPPDEARAQLCRTLDAEDTCSGPFPWVITFGHNDVWGYRAVALRPSGQLAVGPLVWEHGGPLLCPYNDSPQLEVLDKWIILTISWSGSDAFEVCQPEGCLPSDLDCECDDECSARRQGACGLVLDPQTLEVTEKRGDCSGPSPV